MKRLQVPILAIVLVVAACAMAFTALRTASKLWYGALYTFTAFLLLTAVLAARLRRGYERAFWFGFAVFGWGFFLLGYRPWMSAFSDHSNPMGQPLNPNLLTSRVILFLLPHLRKPTNHLGGIDEITQITLGLAHLLMALIVGIAGGLIAVLLKRRSRGRISVKSLAVMAGLALAASIATSISSARSPARFFPEEIFGEFVDDWYSKHLDAMGEPSLLALSQRDRDVTVYRLLWLPSFDHPVCVRIERRRWSESSRQGPRRQGRIRPGPDRDRPAFRPRARALGQDGSAPSRRPHSGNCRHGYTTRGLMAISSFSRECEAASITWSIVGRPIRSTWSCATTCSS